MHVPVPTERSFIGSERLFCWSHKCSHWLDNSKENNHIRSHFELTVDVQTMPTLLTRKMQSIPCTSPKKNLLHTPYTIHKCMPRWKENHIVLSPHYTYNTNGYHFVLGIYYTANNDVVFFIQQCVEGRNEDREK